MVFLFYPLPPSVVLFHHIFSFMMYVLECREKLPRILGKVGRLSSWVSWLSCLWHNNESKVQPSVQSTFDCGHFVSITMVTAYFRQNTWEMANVMKHTQAFQEFISKVCLCWNTLHISVHRSEILFKQIASAGVVGRYAQPLYTLYPVRDNQQYRKDPVKIQLVLSFICSDCLQCQIVFHYL